MNEVTDKNFNKLYPKIEKTLKNASFIAIDSEFTGLISEDGEMNSLFDTPAERYTKLKQNIQPFVAIQFGLTAFQHSKAENTFEATTYNFSLLPRTIPTKNRYFISQVASLEFLSSYKFDFNNIMYNGISFVNEEEEAELQKLLEDDTLWSSVEQYSSYLQEDLVQDGCHKVFTWLKENDSTSDKYEIMTDSPVLQYLMHKEIRTRFTDVWTLSTDNSLIVLKITKDVREVLEKEEDKLLENALIDYYLGFSRIFKLLVSLKKPIIGHNLLLDLLYMYKQFYRPLPNKYVNFKSDIHRLFPIIYDTKHLCHVLNDSLTKTERFKISSLGDIYEYFKNSKGKFLTLNCPVVKTNEIPTETQQFHNAGWDSYCTGYIFTRILHGFCVKKFGEGIQYKTSSYKELMNSVIDYKNCVNMIRGKLVHMKLDGDDPKSHRPEWLFVKTLNPDKISILQISNKLSSFGSVDVKPFTRQRALVAVANQKCMQDILQHFKSNTDFQIVPYSRLKHSPSIKIALWSSVIVSSSVFVVLVKKLFQNPA